MRPCIKKFKASDEYYFDEGCYITELSNSDGDPELSIARAVVKPGVTTNLHVLQSTIERYVILEGVGMVEVEGIAPSKVEKFDVVIIPSGCKQRITNIGNENLVFLAICSPRFQECNYINKKFDFHT